MRAVSTVPPATTDTARLFLAIWPAPDAHEALLAWRDAWSWNSRARHVPPERLHLTLHFLGDVPRRRLPDMTQGLQVAWRPFDLLLDHAELWPHGVAVLRPVVVPEHLLQLHAALRDALQRMDLPTESRAFRPHITLARRAHGATPPAQGPRLRWSVRAYTLVESQPDSTARYHVLQRYA